MGYVWIPPPISLLADAIVIIKDRKGIQLICNVGLAPFATLHPASLAGHELGHVCQHFALSFAYAVDSC